MRGQNGYQLQDLPCFAAGAYRGVGVGSIFVISDILSEEDWIQGYHSAEKLEGLKKAFEVALEVIAIETRMRGRW